MSGSGSGGGGGDWRRTSVQPSEPSKGTDERGERGRASADPCDVTEVTLLNSPNRTVVSTLRVGDRLVIELRPGPPRQLLAVHASQIAGSITSPKSAQIILCIQRQNRAYIAEVRSIRGGLCEVEIRPE